MSAPNIVCKYCGHSKHWHFNEGPCNVMESDRNDPLDLCDCEAWDYGVKEVSE